MAKKPRLTRKTTRVLTLGSIMAVAMVTASITSINTTAAPAAARVSAQQPVNQVGPATTYRYSELTLSQAEVYFEVASFVTAAGLGMYLLTYIPTRARKNTFVTYLAVTQPR